MQSDATIVKDPPASQNEAWVGGKDRRGAPYKDISNIPTTRPYYHYP